MEFSKEELDFFLSKYQEFLKIPSISATGEGIKGASSWVWASLNFHEIVSNSQPLGFTRVTGKPAHLLFTVTPFGKTMSGVTVLILTIKVYKLHGLSKTVVNGN